MFRVGREALANGMNPALVLLIRAIGVPRQVYRQLPRAVAKFSTTSTMEIVEVGPTAATIRFTLHEGYAHSRLDCDYVQGLLGAVPRLRPARRGGPARRVRVRRLSGLHLPRDLGGAAAWAAGAAAVPGSPPNSAPCAPAAQAAVGGDRPGGQRRPRDGAAPDRQPRGRGGARPALPPRGGRPRGWRPAGAQRRAARCRACPAWRTGCSAAATSAPTPSSSTSSPPAGHGRLAAIYLPGDGALGDERSMLGAYADHAAAALDLVMALEDARREADRAGALLALAHELAGGGRCDGGVLGRRPRRCRTSSAAAGPT